MAAGVIVGAQSDFRSFLGDSSLTPPETAWLEAFIRVLRNNAPAAALLYAGTLTAGTVTLIVWPIVSAYVGATFRASAGILGLHDVVGTIWPYAPLEFLALSLAATAGLMPLVAGLRSAFAEKEAGVLRAYAWEIPASLKVVAASLILLAVAAAVEASIIAF
jgi:uncharacterized membrane protein SpoIIM required for sporulation